MWAHLSNPTVAIDDPRYSDVVRRALGHLGDYVELIVRPLNMRPTGATLLRVDADRIEVRITASNGHVVIVIGPDADLAGELFWLKSMAVRNLPAHQVVAHDLSGARVPFSYLLLRFIGGTRLSETDNEAHLRIAARAVGRTIRRAHQITTPSFGRPLMNGRWPTRTWAEVLADWITESGAHTLAEQLLLPTTCAALWAATLEHPELACQTPTLLHGAIGPDCAQVTAGEGIQIEAIIRPGRIVAGDPLLDLATALLPSQPAAFRQGFLDGYASAGPLDQSQRLRLRRFGILALLVHATTDPDDVQRQQLPALIESQLGVLESNDAYE